ncbi:BspA family leucine-rich repeat surface protein [Mycoplasma cottewii]|uniref:BspA family leucine-rich repeat surface protein n=1 Tax=Mycoplasma cottewii TaxID=51364 RepID=A0ABY5TXR4_9MOLU|nr:BspA family leucine-rich repeat surface protein [Mycoplasma cottewii]UWD34801.1 BspA family leucine-rich repeat surface protein [Mycoplasma cottewii]
MKKSKLIALISVLIPTALAIPTFVGFNFSKRHNHSINNQSDNANAEQLNNSLNGSIRRLREKISEISSQIGSLKSDKDSMEAELNKAKLELEELQKIKDENVHIQQEIVRVEQAITRMKDEIKSITENIEKLKLENEQNKSVVEDLQGKIRHFEANERVIKEVVERAWSQKIRETIWGGESCQDLLQRFERASGIKLELEDSNKKFNLIETHNMSNGPTLKVKLNSIEIELFTAITYPRQLKKHEGATALDTIGYTLEGRIEPISPHITKVPEELPWFITDLSNAFEHTQATEIENLEKWDTSNVTNMSHMFHESPTFNHKIERWNVSKVENFTKFLWSAQNFRQSLASWKMHPDPIVTSFMNPGVPIFKTVNAELWEAFLPIQVKRNLAEGTIHWVD